ncbi:RNA 3'-terminal phosphate cyclase [Candidatus Woesearchaeota archaeon]|nr:RNA 3'-terminal phosphate cyclase [Candidatus Woesearchaeota archaeon]
MLEIDGSYGEGGGQIIRTALALSTITGKPFEAFNIRKGRKAPGLKAQHLHCIKALEQLCSAKSKFVDLGSEKLTYEPGKIKGKTISIDIGTAGSVSLLLQSLLIPSFFSDNSVRLKITGGTSGKWAMPYDFFNNVFVPQIKKYCKKIDVKLIRRGYYPKGGGKIDIKIIPLEAKTKLPKLNSTEQHNLIQIKGISHASNFLEKAQVAERQAKAAKLLLNKFEAPINIQTEYADTLCPGSGITLWAIFSKDKNEIDINNPIRLGADALGERGKPAEKVGQEAANKLIQEIESNAPIDPHTADNLIPFLALSGGQIKVSQITNHTKTNIWICEQFLDKKFEIDQENKLIKVI